jgi:hypothetical protein
MKLVKSLTIFFSFLAAIASGSEPPLHPIDEKLDGPESLYTEKILKLIKEWPKGRTFCHAQNEPQEVQTIGIRTEGRPYYVGFQKCMVIHAPLAQVEAVKDDVEHYQKLFPGFKEVKLVEQDGNKMVLSWKREIPVIFVPAIEYKVNYVVDKSTPNRRIYRYQFKGGDRIKFSDGIEVLDSLGPNVTLFTNYEFYEANYDVVLGIKATSAERVWRDSLEGSYLSIFSIRLKAEHPDWDYPRIEKERRLLVDKMPADAAKYTDKISTGSAK